MSHITDYKRDSMLAIVGGSATNIDTLEITYLQSLGATSDNVNDAWMEVFLANGATSTNFNTAANQFLIALGAPGTNLSDNWAWFWITNGGVIGPYDPGMMAFDGSSYYNGTPTTSGNKQTTVIRVNIPSFSGGSYSDFHFVNGAAPSHSRIFLRAWSNDHTTAYWRGRIQLISFNSAGAAILNMLSTNVQTDGTDKLIFAAFDGDAGTAVFRIDGVDEDDAGYVNRALTTGTMTSGSSTMRIGANATGARTLVGEVGYFGTDDSYLTNYADFGTGAAPLEIDESGWTEWGAQPLYWNQYGTMTDNKGSAGNMTETGTITGPA